MAYSVLVMNKVAATDVSIYNRSAISNVNIENGNVFHLATQGSGSAAECWSVTIASGSTTSLGDLWMACSPEVVTTESGTLKYRGLNTDPRNFINSASYVFDAFQPKPGDIVTLSEDAFSAAIGSSSFANAYDNGYDLVWNAAATATSILCFKKLATTYISIGSGAIDDQRVKAYKMLCVSNI